MANWDQSCIISSETLVERIGNNIQRLRSKKNISQKELAKIVEINQGYISTVERGAGNPSIKMLERIARGLNVKLQELIR